VLQARPGITERLEPDLRKRSATYAPASRNCADPLSMPPRAGSARYPWASARSAAEPEAGVPAHAFRAGIANSTSASAVRNLIAMRSDAPIEHGLYHTDEITL